MNASIVIPTPDLFSKIAAQLPEGASSYVGGGGSVSVIEGLNNFPPEIASRVAGLGAAVVTFGKIVTVTNDYGRFLKLTAHCPIFDLIRDRLADLYQLRAFPESPHVLLCRFWGEPSMGDVDPDLFAGVQFRAESLLISDEQAWHQYPVSLLRPFDPADAGKYAPGGWGGPAEELAAAVGN